MKKLTITVGTIGVDGFLQLRNQLDDFVGSNFNILYTGACRLGFNIDKDYYAPRRIQINSTRLHEFTYLKYADGHKYNSNTSPSEENLRNTVRDLQLLLDAAAKNIKPPFTIEIKEAVAQE